MMLGLIGLLELVLFLPLFLLGILATAFWVWMLIEVLTKESSQNLDKLVWAVVILFTHAFGALLYFLLRRPKRRAEMGT
jgi:hypothetical protein